MKGELEEVSLKSGSIYVAAKFKKNFHNENSDQGTQRDDLSVCMEDSWNPLAGSIEHEDKDPQMFLMWLDGQGHVLIG